MIEIKFKGQGGQGVVVASEILGKACFLEGKFPQCFSLFGGERRGAPVVGFVRVDIKPVLLKCQIRLSDHLVLFHSIDEQDIYREVKPSGVILVNTHFGIDLFREWNKFRMGLVDATRIARDNDLGETVNTAMLGAYLRVTNLVRMEALIEALCQMVPGKRDENIQAAREAYRKTEIYEPEK